MTDTPSNQTTAEIRDDGFIEIGEMSGARVMVPAGVSRAKLGNGPWIACRAGDVIARAADGTWSKNGKPL